MASVRRRRERKPAALVARPRAVALIVGADKERIPEVGDGHGLSTSRNVEELLP
jgi:hypothetical protein